ncbi:hypothetical protein [Nocardioides sp. TF02-7]|uniref:hypothetical protein n=1 Tax=Nocardioides sp. TF02-7 TaxID=2917724 RepID=UPI001F06EFB9|nr:hypothetical protein [Nocardioides sp. TF02-7]UMG94026.1 hypothetical protein MF408_08130 [Nocardioides sp. TF02-7]
MPQVMPPSADLPDDAWIGSRVSIGWLSAGTPPGVQDQVHAAWQELFREPAWRAWMIEHEAVIYDDDVEMYLWVEDRAAVRVRYGASLDLYLPAQQLLGGPHRVREVARDAIRRIYGRLAGKVGLPAPPAV